MQKVSALKEVRDHGGRGRERRTSGGTLKTEDIPAEGNLGISGRMGSEACLLLLATKRKLLQLPF